MNQQLAENVLKELEKAGVKEISVCPGARNAPFISVLTNEEKTCYWWYEERSAAFFSLGRARSCNCPTAVLTTSGTAAAELLAAAMEAYYSGVPLVFITADRPRRFRGTAAPQTVEQKGLFGIYAPCSFDIAYNEPFSLDAWDRRFPAHINVCFEEPILESAQN